ncbi:related to microsomal glutathione S-transferase 3 [Serendipita indica DSM 11827]|uniref:Glutathione S-transferase 3, mitochondrial n=1 Tax=Serendipita indica (strain DSM 11827) TaxID=1109443 RepID=G4T5I3_SERID|nr:related to microsomal glutathione S-transferase 3 [Serendipita indica DSM 11827]
MSLTFTISQDYALVASAATATGFLGIWQGIVVSKWRRLSGIKYPQTYAEVSEMKENKNAHIFNCAQRAHMNMLEHLPSFLAALFWTGLRYPRTAAALGWIWVLGRILYTTGYVTGDPQARYRGAIHYIGEYGLYLVGLWSSYELYRGMW